MGIEFDKMLGHGVFKKELARYLVDRGFTEDVMTPRNKTGDGYESLTTGLPCYAIGFYTKCDYSDVELHVIIHINTKDMYVEVEKSNECLAACRFGMSSIFNIEQLAEHLEVIPDYVESLRCMV